MPSIAPAAACDYIDSIQVELGEDAPDRGTVFTFMPACAKPALPIGIAEGRTKHDSEDATPGMSTLAESPGIDRST